MSQQITLQVRKSTKRERDQRYRLRNRDRLFPPVSAVCEECGQPYRGRKWNSDYKPRFCSKSCAVKYRKRRDRPTEITVKCLSCDSSMLLLPYLAKRRRFCSLSCSMRYISQHRDPTYYRRIGEILRKNGIHPPPRIGVQWFNEPNGLESKFIAICRKLSLPLKYTGDGSFWIGRINPDFIDSSGKRIAVDLFGSYWHSPLFNHSMSRIRTMDARIELASDLGWRLIVIWENDVKENIIRARFGGLYP